MKIQKVEKIAKPKYPTFEEIKTVGKIVTASAIAISTVAMSGCGGSPLSGDVAIDDASSSVSDTRYNDSIPLVVGETLLDMGSDEISAVTSPSKASVVSKIITLKSETSHADTSVSQSGTSSIASSENPADTSTQLEGSSAVASSFESSLPDDCSIPSHPSSADPTETLYPGVYSIPFELSSIVFESGFITAGMPSQSIYSSTITSEYR